MDANDDQFVRKSFFQVAQLRDVMQAIDSAERPKLEQNNFAFEFSKSQGTRRVEPFQVRRELGGIDESSRIEH